MSKKIASDAPDLREEEIEVINALMAAFAEKSKEPPKEGDIVEGPVIALDRARLYIDLPPWGTGIIYGREYMNAREIIKRVNVGDRIAAKVVALDNKEGY